jgi:hypothetical protein
MIRSFYNEGVNSVSLIRPREIGEQALCLLGLDRDLVLHLPRLLAMECARHNE